MIHGHGGNINEVARQFNCRPSEIVDMSSNINPLGPPPGLLPYLKDNLDTITRLPEVDAGETVNRFGSFIGVDSNRLPAGNGTTDFVPGLDQIEKNTDQRQQFYDAFSNQDGFRLFKNRAPFILVKLNGGLSAHVVWQSLARDKILIRRCSNVEGLSDRYIRISLKTPEDNRLVGIRLKFLCHGPEKKAGPLNGLQVA